MPQYWNIDRTTLVELLKACKEGDYKKFLKLVSSCDILKFADFEIDDTLLHNVVHLQEPEDQSNEDTCIRSKLEMLEYLIKAGVDVNATDSKQCTPLHVAAHKGFISAVKLLIESGADVNAKYTDDDGKEASPIILACRFMHHEIVSLLMKYGANHEGITEFVILDIIRNGDVSTLKALVDNGFRVNGGAPGVSSDSPMCEANPLHEASRAENVAMVKILINANYDVTCRHKNRFNDIHLMAFKGDKEVIKLLVDKGACVEALSPRLETPLFLACSSQNLDTFQQLLECGANPFHRNIKGESLMTYAIRGGNVEIVKILVKLGLEFEKLALPLDCYDNFEFSPLSAAAFFKCWHIFIYLLEIGFQADQLEENGSSVIHFAAHGGSYEITECILNLGIGVNIMDKNLKTPLHIAKEGENDNLYDLLITYYCADVSLGSSKEMTDLDENIDSLLKQITIDGHSYSTGVKRREGYCSHVLKLADRLKAAGLAFLNRSVNSILPYNDDKDYYKRCMEEINLIKAININNNQTLYNFLSGSLKARIGLINVPETWEALLKMYPFVKFPIYSSMLSVRLKRAMQMNHLLEIGTKFFMSLEIEPKLNNDCIHLVLSFINVQSLIALEKVIIEA